MQNYIINHDRHFNCSAGRTQNVSGVDLIQLDSLIKHSVQKVNNLDLITKNLQLHTKILIIEIIKQRLQQVFLTLNNNKSYTYI